MTSNIFILLVILVTLGKICSSQTINCTITEFSQVHLVTQSCDNIVISNITVPAKKSLELLLLPGTKLVFQGKTTFEYAEWYGPLIRIQGDHLKVTGAPDSVIDGQGALYWDTLGGNGGKPKPRFIRIRATNSTIEGISLLNCPVHCVSISDSNDIVIRNWTIDVSDGDKNNFTGHNTDGFDVSSVQNLVIENCIVKNQDDCVAINGGSNILISQMYCSGGHGLSFSVGRSLTDFYKNYVNNITIINSIVHRSANGIHLKTHTDSGVGLISDILYENIYLSEISNFGINVEQNYAGGEANGEPKGNIPIIGLILNNVTGTMRSFRNSPTLAVHIICGPDGCLDWSWNNVVIEGAQNENNCNYEPEGYPCTIK